MKKLLENKQTKPSFRSYPEFSTNFSDTEFIEKESRIVERKSKESSEQCISCMASTSNNCEFVDIKLPFDNSEFDNSDSEIQINLRGFDEQSFAGQTSLKDSEEEAGVFSQINSIHNSSASREIKETNACVWEVLPKESKSSIYMEQSSSDLFLKKTTKITNFNTGEFDRGRLADDAGIKCTAELLTAVNEKKSTLKRRKKSNDHADETEMVVVDDVDATLIFPNQFSELCERPDQSYMDTEDNMSDQDHLGKRPEFRNDRTVSFFLKKRGKTSQRSKFTQKRIKFNDSEKSVTTGRRVPDSEVPPEVDIEIKQYLFDFYFYVIFLILITTIALCMVSSNMFYFTDVTVNFFFDTPNIPALNRSQNSLNLTSNTNPLMLLGKTLKESNTYKDFWAFAETTMIDLFYWDFYDSKIDPLSHTEKDDRKMLYENEILGVPRIRQVRVRNDSCEIHPNMKRFFQNCYYYYTIFSEETRPIKTGMEGTSTATAWVYTKAKDLKTLYYWGEISIYGGGGYYLDFDIRKNKTKEMIQELKKNNWVSRATRAIFIDFNIYNSNVNLFLICKIVLEFPPVGGMLPRKDFHAVKLIRYLTRLDFFILACEFVVILFVIYFTYIQIVAWKKQKFSYFAHWWNYIDLSILLLLYTYIILSIVRFIYTQKLISQLQNNYYKYTEFATAKELQIVYNNTIAVLVFLCWIKLFMFFNFTVRMIQFKTTLSRSLKDILGFFPLFLTMFVAFAVLAYLLFGNQVKNYDSVWSSFLALLQAFLGEFEYAQIEESNKILGPIFYVTFIFFIFFVLLNVFIAIINDAYASVKSEIISDKPKAGAYFKRGFFNFFGWCDCRKNKKFKKTSSVKRKLLYDDIKKSLSNAGFSEDEIKIFFTKYDINVENIVDEKTRKKVVEDLELQRIDFSENSVQYELGALRRQLDNLNARIEEIEINLQPVIDKIDVLLSRR